MDCSTACRGWGTTVPIRLIVDVRCLQDPNYALRGIGQHVRSLLQYRTMDAATARFHLIGVRDRDLPPLAAEDSELFEDIRTTAYDIGGSPTAFLSPSPMTHSPLPFARLMMQKDVYRAAIIHDFIPYERLMPLFPVRSVYCR